MVSSLKKSMEDDVRVALDSLINQHEETGAADDKKKAVQERKVVRGECAKSFMVPLIVNISAGRSWGSLETLDSQQ
jgi:hypothetical protein